MINSSPAHMISIEQCFFFGHPFRQLLNRSQKLPVFFSAACSIALRSKKCISPVSFLFLVLCITYREALEFCQYAIFMPHFDGDSLLINSLRAGNTSRKQQQSSLSLVLHHAEMLIWNLKYEYK